MIKRVIAINIILTLLISCSNDTDRSLRKVYVVEGVAVDELTNEPVSSAHIFHRLCLGASDNPLFDCGSWQEGDVTANDKGNFSILLRYENLSDIFKYHTSISLYNPIYSPIFKFKEYTYTIEEIKKLDKLIIKLNKLTRLVVSVENLTPFDNQDKIEIKKTVFEDPEIEPQMEYFSVVNYGTTNETIDYGDNLIGDLLVWNGENVKSNIDGMIISNRNVYIEYEVTKNGKTSLLSTTTKLMKRDSYNFFEIKY